MPHYELICRNPACEKNFNASRSDKKYCSNACRMAHSRARKRVQQAQKETVSKYQKPIFDEVKATEKELADFNEALRQKKTPKIEMAVNPPKQDTSKEQVKLETDIIAWKQALKFSNVQLYNLLMNPEIQKLQKYCPENIPFTEFLLNHGYVAEMEIHIQKHWIDSLPLDAEIFILDDLEKKRTRIPGIIENLQIKLEKLKSKSKKRPFNFKSVLSEEYLLGEIEKLSNKIAELKKKLNNPPPEILGIIPKKEQRIQKKQRTSNRKSTSNSPSDGFRPGDIRRMDHNSFQLKGEIGYFLGNLERNMLAIALTGDSGAGKSTFSYQLAKTFLGEGFQAKYFSLEEGVGKLTAKKLDQAGIDDLDDITIVPKGTLREVRNAASDYDLILIDSFQKLGAKPEEFDRLRQDFPETIFISIFQKTSSGKIRGGSQIKFDSSATINVKWEGNERVAIMEKGRYGTQGWVYSITRGEVIYDGSGER